MSRAIYLFRNIRTNQVISSMNPSLVGSFESKTWQLIKTQVGKANLRPTKIRADHWSPLVVVTGFESEEAARNAFTLVSQNGHPLRPKTENEKKKYIFMKNKDKKIADLNTAERQVAQLVRTMIYLDAVNSHSIPKQEDAKISLLWNRDSDWIRKVRNAGLNWPQWIKHEYLDLKRGSIFVDHSLRASKK